jgi:hypothetical protein
LIFAKANADDMKQKGQVLRDVRQRLRECHTSLIHEHNQEIWERILAVQANHDAWWGQWKAHKGQRDEERAAKAKRHEEWKERKAAWEMRVNENLGKNRDKLAKAENALEKFEAHAQDLREKIESAWNDEFKERAEGWLEEQEARIKNIEEHIERIKQWIEEDERKLQG